MDPRNPNPSNPPPSMRVLTRPPASPTPPSPAPSYPRQPDGVVVVGFISRSFETSSQLINRVLDSNAFGSGRLDKPIFPEDKEDELREWFRHRRISYYHEEDKGAVFLLLSATRCPVVDGLTGQSSEIHPFLDNWEFEELQGMIFMFSVCHVILYIQEGSSFDTQALKKLRVLQAAKNSLAPYVRSKAAPPFPSRSNSLSNSGKRTLAGSSSGRGGGMISRNASAVSLMSGLGSNNSLFPGQCTPVLLFVFVDEFPDVADPSSSVEESTDNSSLNPSSNMSSLARPNPPAKGSGPVVMLVRPGNKSEGGLRKKMQSSLEAQLRFLIKKCRILTGFESGHTGSRNGAVSSSNPLFSLDTSRAVALLDRRSVQRTESLEFAIDLVEDVLNGKATSEIFLLESHAQGSNKEDILMIKDFIHRQCDMVRGRGGLVTGTNSSPATGVGMVAVAAAAAAASAASGKAFSTPELPTLETWLSSSKVILNKVLLAKGGSIGETGLVKRKPNEQNCSPSKVEGGALKGADPIDVAVSQLESGRGLITKFSMSWCEKALPTAMDFYLKDLPACYPTSQHKVRLERALQSFHSMVRGPVVKLFAKKLEDDCISIWKSGRQQCDAISLTGKPCIHQRHEITNGESACAYSPIDSHSSGYFFLHACACGRSRQLRPDPFDMESANVRFNCFPNCDKLLPEVQLPENRHAGPVQSSSWKLVCIGGASYYEPSKGLLQSGFSAKQRFLLKWTISPHRSRSSNTIPARILHQGSLNISGRNPDIVSNEIDAKRSGIMRLQWGNMQNDFENQREITAKSQTDDKKTSFDVGIPNFAMQKPFAEVVAGSSASDSFPPLKQSKHASTSTEKSIKQNKTKSYRLHSHMDADQTSQKSEVNTSGRDISSVTSNGFLAHDRFVRIGSNVISVDTPSAETEKMSSLLEPAVVYVGFEHECPHGHRFLLNPEQLNEFETLYPLTQCSTSSFETSESSQADPLNSKNGIGKVNLSTKGMVVNFSSKFRGADRSKCVLANGDVAGMVKFQGLRKEPDQASTLTRADSHSLENIHVELHRLMLDDGGSVFNMLNRDLPIYMNCPYCKKSKDKKGETKIMFADAISQLQRIFLVTPPFPVVLATCPVIQFEASCLPTSVLEKDKKLQYSFGCPVILPPESFLALRLPFVYGIQLEDGSLHPLKALDSHPERTAWIEKGTAIQVLSQKISASERPQT